jgi:hypothetical protein
MHLSNLSTLLRAGGGKNTANELDEFIHWLQPYRDKKLKDLIGTINQAEEILRNGPPAPKARQAAARVDVGPISSRIVELYQQAALPTVTQQDIVAAFAELESVSLTAKQLEPIAKQIGIREKLKKQELFNKMRQTVLDRKGAADRVFA